MRVPVPAELLPADQLGAVHFIGIGGAGLSGIARIMLARGITVSGSDARHSPTLEALGALGASCHVGHAAQHVHGAATVVVSTAVRADNPEVVEATRLARLAAPDLLIDGELQFDAAFVEAVSSAKAPHSALHGEANVFVFPNLDAANIGYKIAQRIGGAEAIGPILQGLAKPANDLSRGCSADDVYNMIAVTGVQSLMTGGESPR